MNRCEHSSNEKNDLKKTGDHIAAVSRLVPPTDGFSNSFYENLGELWDLRSVLIAEGLMDKQGYILAAGRMPEETDILSGR